MTHAKSNWLRSALRSTELKAVAVIAALLALVSAVVYRILRAESPEPETFFFEFAKGVHVELTGLLFDVFLFGLLIHIVRFRDEAARVRADIIDRNMEILDDLRTWGSEEATLRITGSLKRLTQYTTNLDLAGLRLSRVVLFDRGVTDFSGSSFSAAGRETRLSEVSFAKVNCRSVRFSEYVPYSAVPLTDDESSAMHDSKRDATLGDRRAMLQSLQERKFPEDLILMIRTILKDNDALDNSPSKRMHDFARSLESKDDTAFPDNRKQVKRALRVLTRLAEPVAFEGLDLDFREAGLEQACFDGARLIWSSGGCPFVGARAENLSFRNATLINADFRGFESLDQINLDGAWFYPHRPFVTSAYGLIGPNEDVSRAFGFIGLAGAINIEYYLQGKD